MNLRHALARLWAAALGVVRPGGGHPIAAPESAHPPGAPSPATPARPENAPLPEAQAVTTETATTPIVDTTTTVTAPRPVANETTMAAPPTPAKSRSRKSAPAPLPDPDFDKLLMRSAKLQGQKLDLGVRLADMEQTVREFEQRQYEALNEILGECLQLRREYAHLKAERSRNAADREAARSAEEDFESYRSAGEVPPAALPELDDDERDELRRLYRTAASRCHPDRAGEADQADAHARFLRVQAAYRANDLGALREVLYELDSHSSAPADARETTHAAGSEHIRRQVGDLQNEVADLILAIQTLQLDSVYRLAVNIADRDAYFDRARQGFEDECAELRSMIRLYGLRAA